ncbi:unnamed protein product [Gadus morhua 'NCC']
MTAVTTVTVLRPGAAHSTPRWLEGYLTCHWLLCSNPSPAVPDSNTRRPAPTCLIVHLSVLIRGFHTRRLLTPCAPGLRVTPDASSSSSSLPLTPDPSSSSLLLTLEAFSSSSLLLTLDASSSSSLLLTLGASSSSSLLLTPDASTSSLLLTP